VSIKLSSVMRCQIAYALIGFIFNVVSVLTLNTYGYLLAPTNPFIGAAAMLLYFGFVQTGYYSFVKLYRSLMALSILVFGYGGVVVHVIRLVGSAELYVSFSVGVLAVVINTIGLVLNVIAAFGLYEQSKKIV
jgi:hypothetical protein